MGHFYLYLANILFVLTLIGLFVFLAGRHALHDGRGLLGQSLRSIGGAAVQRVLNLPTAALTPEARHLLVLEAAPESGFEVGHRFPLRVPITKIGRSSNNHIVLPDPLVSSTHAALAYEDGMWWIEDQHSRNGTVLYPVSGSSTEVQDKPAKFQLGDVLQIGDTRLRLEA